MTASGHSCFVHQYVGPNRMLTNSKTEKQSNIKSFTTTMKIHFASVLLLSASVMVEAEVSYFSATNLPEVENYDDAVEFCKGKGLVLATEAEWCEYAKENPGLEYGMAPFLDNPEIANVELACGITNAPTDSPTGVPTAAPTAAPVSSRTITRTSARVGSSSTGRLRSGFLFFRIFRLDSLDRLFGRSRCWFLRRLYLKGCQINID